MGDIVATIPDRQKLIENIELLVDLARYSEGIVDEAAIRKKYRLAEDVWNALGEDDDFVRAVTDEKTRRIRTGASKRERAQGLIVKGPAILDSIAADVSASPRHRVDALKVLNDFAANPADHTPTTSDRFIITINLGGDHVERYDKSISINADDVAPGDTEVAPQKSLPASIPDKRWDDDNAVTAPVKAPAPTHTGYRQVDPGKIPDKKPAAHKPVEPMTDSRSAYDIALASLMEKG